MRGWIGALAAVGALAWADGAAADIFERALRPVEPERLREGWLGVWLLVLIAVQAASVLFAYWWWGARATLLGLVALFGYMALIAPNVGLPMLDGYLSLLHLVFWTPALVILIRELATTTRLRSLYGVWSVLTVAVISASFIVDVPDGLIYAHHVLTT